MELIPFLPHKISLFFFISILRIFIEYILIVLKLYTKKLIINTMSNYNGKLIELPKEGKAVVVTDLHGNLNDYNRYIGIWEKYRDNDNNTHFILTGDFIHAMGIKDDKSIDILESVKYNWENSKKFHVLLGNHEWSTISSVSIFKGGLNQSLNFKGLLKDRFRDQWQKKLEEYQDFFKKLPIAVKTDNKVFISHAGLPKFYKN